MHIFGEIKRETKRLRRLAPVKIRMMSPRGRKQGLHEFVYPALKKIGLVKGKMRRSK
jgi:hypothetical protein